MWAIRQVISYLWSSADWLDNAGTWCNLIPIVGSSVRYALQSSAVQLRYAAWSLYDFDSWVDNLRSTADAAYANAQTVWTYATGYLQQQVQSALTTANSAYNYAAGYLQQQVQSALSTANSAYNYATGYLQQQIRDLNAVISGILVQTQTVVGNIGSTAWTWISSGYLQQWIQNWWLGQQQAVLDLITPKLDWLIAQGFLVLDRSWSSFEGSFAWLCGKLVDLLTRQAVSFARPLWSLLEAVLKNIHIPER